MMLRDTEPASGTVTKSPSGSGTGSWLAPAVARVARLLREKFTKDARVCFVDPDKVLEKNIYRQNFCRAVVAAVAADYLVRLLLTKNLDKFQTYIDLNSGSMQSTTITPANVGKWRRR